MDRNKEIDVKALTTRLRTKGMNEMVVVYKLYRDEFLNYTNKYNCDRELRINAFHDAIIVLYEHLLQERYDEQKSSVKTYLFQIAKNKIFTNLKQTNRHYVTELSGEILNENRQDWPLNNKDELSEQEEIIKLTLEQMGEKCREILVLFYYHQYTTDAIQHTMGYPNRNVVDSQKSRCLKQLRKLVNERIKKESTD